MEANLALEKKLNKLAWVITVVVLLLVGLMRGPYKIPLPEGWSLGFLPPFHATVNALTAVMLIAALYFVKTGNIEAHKKSIFLAFGFSAMFLLSYVAYHFTTAETLFGDLNGDRIVDAGEKLEAGFTRTVYFAILISHIVLAAVIFPFTLFTFIRAFTNQIDRHKKMARWVFPIWLYVAITGPVCYWMLSPYYQ